MTSVPMYISVVAIAWLLSLAACVFALRWSFKRSARRFRAAVALSIFALVIGVLGLTQADITYTRTVDMTYSGAGGDSHSVVNIDCERLFLVPLLLGSVSLAVALWSRGRSNDAEPSP